MFTRLLTIYCLFIAVMAISCFGADINILENPGFESGVTGWSGRNCSISAESTTVRTGSGSAKASNRVSTWQGIKQDVLGGMEAGETYAISGWVKLENSASETVTLSIQKTDDSGTNYYTVASTTANNTNWIGLSGTFTYNPTGTTTILYIYFEGPAVDVNFFVDDVNVFGESDAEPWSPPDANATGTISFGTRYQELEGFGAAGAWYEDYLTGHPDAEALYDLLFDDLGIDIYRLRNSYDQGTAGANYISHQGTIVTEAKERNPNLKIMLSSWSPPTYLKSNSALAGGTLTGGPSSYNYTGFADWWADSIEEWSSYGVDANYINIQNEPDYTASWDTCRFEPTQTTSYAGYNQAFEAVYDEIYSRMGANMPKMLAPETAGINASEDYLDAILDDSHVYGYAHHLYGVASWDDPDAYITTMNLFRTNYGDKPILQTEYAVGSDYDLSFSDTMNLALLIHNSLVEESASVYLHWELFWASAEDWKALVNLSLDDYTINPMYWAMKHYSAFTDPGWERVAATTDSTGARMSAFVNPDNDQMSVILINTSTDTNITMDLSFAGFSLADGNVYRSSETENCELVGTYDGEPILLPTYSITTLELSILPPSVVADAGPDQTVYAFTDGYADVTLDGSGSIEINDLPLTYEWSWTVDGNEYDANGVSPTIELPVGTTSVQLIADNGTELSEPDTCSVTVTSALGLRGKCKPKTLKIGKLKSSVITIAIKMPKGTAAADVNLNDPLLFYPGGLESLSLSAVQKGKPGRYNTTVYASFDVDDCLNELDGGANVVQFVGKLATDRYYYSNQVIKVILPKVSVKAWEQGESDISVSLLLRAALADFNEEEPVTLSPGLIEPLTQTAGVDRRGTVINLTYDIDECSAYLTEGKNAVQLTGKLIYSQNFTANASVSFAASEFDR
jgi:glucuronoarabinoxylan endo-1,4-beta-xylanase